MSYVFMLNEDITAWMLKKQHIILIFTIEAEYIALRHSVKQKVWMQKFINELRLNNIILSITLLKDNKLSIKLVYNVKQHSCMKYINI